MAKCYKLLLRSAVCLFFVAGQAHAAAVPEINEIIPESVTVGHQAFILNVEGEKVNANSELYFYWYENIPTSVAWCFTPDGNGPCGTLTHDDEDLFVDMPAGFFQPAWTYWVRIFNPGPGGGTSSAVSFTVYNAPPTADNLVFSSDACQAIFDVNSVFFIWDYNDLDGDNEKKFHLQIDDNSDFTSPEVERIEDNLNQPAGTSNQQMVSIGIDELAYNTTYHWRVQVWQEPALPSQSDNSGWVNGANYTTIVHPWPYATFSYTPTSPAINFTNNSICYDIDGVCNSYTWDFGDGNTSTQKDPNHPYDSQGTYNVSLTVTDGDGFQCQNTQPVSVQNQPANTSKVRWKEFATFWSGFYTGEPECSDGLDNDGDSFFDYPIDADCLSASDVSELSTECNNTIDDDVDTFIDYPADSGCISAVDNSEL